MFILGVEIWGERSISPKSGGGSPQIEGLGIKINGFCVLGAPRRPRENFELLGSLLFIFQPSGNDLGSKNSQITDIPMDVA